MRSRINVAFSIIVFIVAVSGSANAAERLEPSDGSAVVARLERWRDRIPELVKRLLKFAPRTNGDHLSPPKP